MREKLKKALFLYAYFFRIGWVTFGGGWSIIAQIQKEFSDRRGEISSTELLDIVSVGRSLPGTMIGNVAYLFGYHYCGAAGGIAALLGIATPPLVLLCFVTVFYDLLRDNVWVSRAMLGVRSAVAPIILSAVLRLHKGAFPLKLCYALCAAGFLLVLVLDVSCVWIVLLGVAAGLVLNARKGGASE